MRLNWNVTPYGFKEALYKGIVITKSDGSYYPEGITIEICGDVSPVKDIKEAKEKIDRYIEETME